MKLLISASIAAVMILAGCVPATANPPPTNAPTPVIEASTAPPTSLPSVQAPTTQPTPSSSSLLAYLAEDGNVWLKHLSTGDGPQVTNDATGSTPAADGGMVQYGGLAWSSDGSMLAFQRQKSTPAANGLETTSSLLVYEIKTGQTRALLEDVQLGGFAWQPGALRIAYGYGVEPGYFTVRGSFDAALAKGIWLVDAVNGETSELVKPERGLHLLFPKWSPNGQVLGFEEVDMYEGRGTFAYVDLLAGKYIGLNQRIGVYNWTPDGQRIVYDTLTYIPSGGEAIWIANRDGSGAQQISPQLAKGYSYQPALSPAGDQVAYLAQFGDATEPGMSRIVLYVQPLAEVAPRELAQFENVYDLVWAPDGGSVLLSVGPLDARVIVQIRVSDGSQSEITSGFLPAVQP